MSLVGFFAALATTAPGRIRRERQSTGRSSHPREDLSFLPHDVHRGSDPEGVGWWGPGSSGSLRTKQDPRFLGEPEWHKEQLAAFRKPFFAGSIALCPLRKGPLSKERPRSTGDCAGLAQERSHSPQLWWLVQTPRPIHYGLKACSQVMSRQFITTVVLEIFSTMATAMS